MSKRCPKCNGEMIKSTIGGNFSCERKDGLQGGTETEKYMCTNCGYIEEYAVNRNFRDDKEY